MVVSDANASWFSSSFDGPLFRDASAGRTAWRAFEDGATKHLTFVYDRDGRTVLRWFSPTPTTFAADIGAAVRAQYR